MNAASRHSAAFGDAATALLARAPRLRQAARNLRRKYGPADTILYLGLPLIFLFLAFSRPPVSFYSLLLAPIALAAVLHEYVGGTLAALAAMVGVVLLVALDPNAARRGVALQEAWPILLAYLGAGPLVGWLAARQRERERELLAAISDAGREIAASLNLDRTLRLVMDKAAETLPMDAGALFRFDTESRLYRVAVSHNLSKEHVDQITFAFDEGVPGWTVRHRHAIIIPEAATDKRVHPYVLEDGVKAVLAIPLEVRDRVVGVLNLYGKTETHAFDDEALRLAQVYADQAAVFIENARLVDELRQAAAELEARVERRTQQLRQSQAQAIRAEKLAVVGRLAGSVAHEVNNPLQAIALHLQLVSEEELTKAAREQLTIVQQELDRIAGIVRTLLDFARPKPGHRAVQDVKALLDDVLALAGKQLQQTEVDVECEGINDLAPVMAVGDQLKQVFLNLVLNAVEAMPDGGTLRIHGHLAGHAITLNFSDTGIGMTNDVLEHLFEPFFSTKQKGSGLGLAVSHEIVSRHGGTLSADSHPGRGATFSVTLPAYSEPGTSLR